MIDAIPGVSLAVLREDRCLIPEEDGYIGELAASSVEIRATVAPGALVYGIRRWGDDSYDLQKDHAALDGLVNGEKSYQARMELEANYETLEPFVSYPNNLLLLAELVAENGCLSNRVRVWRVAIVSQEGHFFLTAQQAYDTTAHRDRAGRIHFPRLEAHPQLEAILTRLRPNGDGKIPFPRCRLPDEKRPKRELIRTDTVLKAAELPPVSSFAPEPEPTLLNLCDHEAYALRFYDARGVGTLLTSRHGIVRVGWRDCPTRPRRRYLVPGERVRYARLGKPILHVPNPRFTGDKTRPARQTSFRLQAFDITPCA